MSAILDWLPAGEVHRGNYGLAVILKKKGNSWKEKFYVKSVLCLYFQQERFTGGIMDWLRSKKRKGNP